MSFILRKLQGGNLEVSKVFANTPICHLHLRKQFLAPFIPTQFGLYILFPSARCTTVLRHESRWTFLRPWILAHDIPLEKEVDRELAHARESAQAQAGTTAQQVVIGHERHNTTAHTTVIGIDYLFPPSLETLLVERSYGRDHC
jgi:hypothetical protein